MAFPVVEATNTSLEDAGNVTSHTVNLPSDIVSGELLIVCFSKDGGFGTSWPEGWIEFFEGQVGGGHNTLALAYREADGTEGSTITVTTSSSDRSTHVSYRISGAEDPDTQAPETHAFTGGDDANPDPANLTPTGGAKDYLWIAVEGHDRNHSLDAIPTDYTNALGIVGGGANSCGINSGRRNLNASSENPGTFTIGGSDTWIAQTIAVHPASVSAPSGIIDQTLPSLTQSATASSIGGAISQTLPSLTQSATALEIYTSTIAQTLPSLTQSATASVLVPVTGAIIQTLPSLTQSATATLEYTATITQTLPSLTQSLTAIEKFEGPIAQTLPALSQSATAVEIYTGIIGQTLPSLAQSATGNIINPITGTITQTLPSLAISIATASSATASVLASSILRSTGSPALGPQPSIAMYPSIILRETFSLKTE